MADFSKVTRIIGKGKLAVTKNSDVITLVASITCGVIAVGSAIYNSRKAVKAIDIHKAKIADIKSRVKTSIEDGVDPGFDPRKETFKVYQKTAWELFKCYAPTACATVGMGGFSIASHHIMKGRYVGALASVAALTQDFDHYRKNVKDELGSEMDEHFMYDTEVIETEETEVDAKGKEKTVKKQTKVAKRGGMYAKTLMSSKRLRESTNAAAYLNTRAALIAANEELVREGFETYNTTLKKYFGYQVTNNFEAGVIDDKSKPDCERFIQIEGFGDIKMSSEGYIHLDTSTESDEIKMFRRGRTDDFILRFKNIQPTIIEDLSRFVPDVEIMEPLIAE